jgi:hypothetical protein
MARRAPETPEQFLRNVAGVHIKEMMEYEDFFNLCIMYSVEFVAWAKTLRGRPKASDFMNCLKAKFPDDMYGLLCHIHKVFDYIRQYRTRGDISFTDVMGKEPYLKTFFGIGVNTGDSIPVQVLPHGAASAAPASEVILPPPICEESSVTRVDQTLIADVCLPLVERDIVSMSEQAVERDTTVGVIVGPGAPKENLELAKVLTKRCKRTFPSVEFKYTALGDTLIFSDNGEVAYDSIAFVNETVDAHRRKGFIALINMNAWRLVRSPVCKPFIFMGSITNPIYQYRHGRWEVNRDNLLDFEHNKLFAAVCFTSLPPHNRNRKRYCDSPLFPVVTSVECRGYAPSNLEHWGLPGTRVVGSLSASGYLTIHFIDSANGLQIPGFLGLRAQLAQIYDDRWKRASGVVSDEFEEVGVGPVYDANIQFFSLGQLPDYRELAKGRGLEMQAVVGKLVVAEMQEDGVWAVSACDGSHYLIGSEYCGAAKVLRFWAGSKGDDYPKMFRDTHVDGFLVYDPHEIAIRGHGFYLPWRRGVVLPPGNAGFSKHWVFSVPFVVGDDGQNKLGTTEGLHAVSMNAVGSIPMEKRLSTSLEYPLDYVGRTTAHVSGPVECVDALTAVTMGEFMDVITHGMWAARGYKVSKYSRWEDLHVGMGSEYGVYSLIGSALFESGLQWK